MSNSAQRRFVSRFEVLEGRDCPAVTVNVFGPVMSVVGDSGANTITIKDNGAGGVTVVGDGVTRTATGIKSILLRGQDGNDNLSYTLTAPLTQAMFLGFDLGKGNDTAKIDLSAGISSWGLGLALEGGDGNDSLDVTLGAIAAKTLSGITVSGGKGDDTLSFAFSGALNGNLGVNVEGQDGADTVTGTFKVDSGSTGRLLTNFGGGKGNDKLSLSVTGTTSGLKTFEAVLDGGEGSDTWTATSNVRTRAVEIPG